VTQTIMLRMADFLPFFHKVFPFLKIGHFFCPFLIFGNTFDPLFLSIFRPDWEYETKIIFSRILMIVNVGSKIQTIKWLHKKIDKLLMI